MDYSGLKTPCYIIDKAKYVRNIEEIMKSFSDKWNENVIFGYSVKTNHYPYLMNIAREYDMHPKKWTTIEMNLETRNQNARQITE